MLRSFICVATGLVLAAGSLWAFKDAPNAAAIEGLDNWPHWRGPLANGTAPRANPPTTWDARTNIKWKAPLPGRGSAIFLHVARPDFAPTEGCIAVARDVLAGLLGVLGPGSMITIRP